MIPHPSETLRHTTTENVSRHNPPPPPQFSPAAWFTWSTKHRPHHHNRTASMSNQTWVAFPRLVYVTTCIIHSAHLQVQSAPTAVLSMYDSFPAVEVLNVRGNKHQLCTVYYVRTYEKEFNTDGLILKTCIKKSYQGCSSFQVFQFRFEYMSTKVFVETL